ncbi:hypothetical protein [Pseudoalteromonas phage PH357]|nr:hypothetical protein [Pseudoalteromonas phage PH357]
MQSQNITKIKRTQKPALKTANIYESDSKRKAIKQARRHKRIAQELNY